MSNRFPHSPTDDQRTTALKLIANYGCERIDTVHYPDADCSNQGDEAWTPYAKDGADSWCHPCVCAVALEGRLPKPRLDELAHVADGVPA